MRGRLSVVSLEPNQTLYDVPCICHTLHDSVVSPHCYSGVLWGDDDGGGDGVRRSSYVYYTQKQKKKKLKQSITADYFLI